MCPERAPPWPPSCRDWLCRALWPRPFRPKLRPSAAPSIWRRCCSSVSPASIGGSAGRWRRRWRRCGADCTASIRPPPSTSAPRRGCSCSPMRSVRWQRWNSPPIRSLGSWRGGPPSPTQLLQILEEPLFLAPTPESITMREAEGAAPPPLLEEAELPEPTPEELQFISEAESELLPHLEEIPEEEEEVGGPAVGRPPPPAAPHSRPPSDPGSAVPRSAPPHSALRPHGWLPPELWDLWVRAARPIAPEPSEVEELREVPEPSVGLLPSSELTLEVTPEELRPLVTPAEEWRAPPPLPELPEEAVLPPVGVASMRRAALEGAARPEGAELHGLLPSSAPRKLWARLFRVCLDLCAAGWLRLEQSRPFGPIGIRLGPRGPAHPSPSPARAE
ncbi:meiotic recombination protein REC8 homolog isoform X16 [Gallus gallus]|uniref:meiotic recombination protein REC8 homolog isoform X16 n=1 Tax=Gallus gallus TaxID=9031 RepID=UPI001AE4B575|nr:meiotic recombination protein REC8 homolog isoform X16 [Gallus gallus]